MADDRGAGKPMPPPGFLAPEGMRFLRPLAVGRRSLWNLAEQVSLGRQVALKTLRPGLAGRPKSRESFFEAGRLAAGLVHRSAIPVINVYPRENCLAMALAEGQSLRELAGALLPPSLAAIGAEVMDCLASLHATGRGHGNLSPGNIFFRDGAVWLDDFFQPPLWAADPDSPGGEAGGFAAPEAAEDKPGDWRADLFSLGKCLSFAASPGGGPDDGLGGLLATLTAASPGARAPSPEWAAAAFRSIRRRAEETRIRLAGGKTAVLTRRLYRRVPAEFDVSLRRRSATPSETASILMRVRDIGESGVFVETDDQLIGVGSILELNFSLKGQAGNVHAFGVVRWRSSPPLPAGVGVQFVEVDRDGLAKLRRFVSGGEGGDARAD